MTIHLPGELESRVAAAVHSGHFASLDDAMAQAARLLLGELDRGQALAPATTAPGPQPSLGSIGAMRDDADFLDEIVADAYRQRQGETWRELDL